MDIKDNKICKKIYDFKEDIIIFSLTFMILIISLLAFYPGIMSSDSMSQWTQIQRNEYTTWHPIFHTLFERGVTLFWNSPAAVALAQSAIFSLIVALIFKLARNKEHRLLINVVQLIILVCIFFIPVNYIYPITLWKDVMYSISLFAVFYFLYKGILIEFKYTLKDNIILAICCTCVALFRYNGIITILVILTVMFLYYIINKRFKEFAKFLIIFFVSYIVLNVPTYLVHKVNGENRYKSGVFIHLIGCFLSDDKINDSEDLTFLNSIYDVNEWKNNYTPYTHDSLMFNKKILEKDEYISQNSDKLKDIVIKYSIENPRLVLKHYYYLTAITWKVLPFDDGKYYSFVDMTKSNKNVNYPITNQKPILKDVNTYLSKYDEMVLSNKVLSIVFYRPALHLYLSVFFVILLVIIKRKKTYFILILPLIANTVSMLPAMPAQDFRYFYINLLSIIGIIIIFVTELIRFCYNNKKVNGE